MIELSSLQYFSFRHVGRTLLVGAMITGWGCAGGVAPPTVETPAPTAEPVSLVDAQEQELRALLLLMSDQKFLDPVTVAAAASGGPDLRRRLAFTLSRVGDPRGGPALQSLLADDDVEVRRAAVFGLGELAERGDRTARQALLAAIADADHDAGRLAVEGAAKAGAPLEDVIQRLLEAPSGEILSRLMPNLFRFDSPGTVGWAKQGLDDPELRPMAAYALTRNPLPKSLETVRPLIGDGDPWIRSLAARALGRIGERQDMGLLRLLLDDPEPGPVVQALKSARLLIAAGKLAAPDAWREPLLALLEDPRSGVRITAIEVAREWLLDEKLSARLERFCREGSVRERELALNALAEADDPRAMSVLPAAYGSELPSLRVVATKAAALMGAGDIVAAALVDLQPGVRAAAFETALEIAPDPTGPMTTVLADPDYVVRSTGLDWATDNPVIAYKTLASAYEVARADRAPDARLGAIKALVARAQAASEEVPAITSILETLAESGDYLSRREAVAGLQALGHEAPRVGKVASRRTIQNYRQIVARTSADAQYAIETDLGRVVLRLMCPEAPLTCLSFMQLADQGFYDGLLFHRIVPDFVVQGGDPRGDGAGGPGYTVRDELNTIPFDAGILGMAHAGSDTTGSQFFLTITPQPHLNGGYTAFGKVIEGQELLREWVQGQKIRRIRRVSNGR